MKRVLLAVTRGHGGSAAWQRQYYRDIFESVTSLTIMNLEPAEFNTGGSLV
ncbi:hypothetical protein O9993_17910 [Vibrio lentus]|nr:hypothetical protein [Vibrio lentus]